ncbi:hypothetical protein U1Q18_026333 [Sarracenia purpurea var. burkii]
MYEVWVCFLWVVWWVAVIALLALAVLLSWIVVPLFCSAKCSQIRSRPAVSRMVGIVPLKPMVWWVAAKARLLPLV